MSNKQRVRIGFVGAGGMGQMAHLRNYTSPELAEECEVVALAEIKPALAQKVAARHGIPKVYASHKEMLASEQLDGIVAAQPFERHGILLPELARAGAPLFCEKPVANSIAAAGRVVRALERHHTWLMVGYHKRSDPATIYARRVVEELKQSGEIGKLRYVRITIPAGDWLAGGFNDLIRTDDQPASLDAAPAPADMDGPTARDYNAFVNYHIHQVNLLRHLLGEDYTVSYADPSRILLAAHTRSGVPGAIEMSPYAMDTDWHETALIAFDRGYIKLRLPAPLAYNRAGTVEIYKSPAGGAPGLTVPTLPWVHAMRNQALNFIKAIRGEAPAPCLAREALEDLKIAREYIRLLRGK
ncbi:MAG: Gfo/Idh/MocA family oxidoreductase [Opitutaceae bacterium]|jgi:predicted dehydrogenase|nr:Gfo/Idh/MocA family oxidoreductase [Opitutaceae bacterium]